MTTTGTGPNSWFGPLDPAADAGWENAPDRVGFFTDTSVCIGCKACEVACKEWNLVPEDGMNLLGSSYDNTGALGASTWRHVAFIEQASPLGRQDAGVAHTPVGPTSVDATAAVAAAAPLSDTTVLGTNTGGVDLGMPSFELPGAKEGAERTDFRWLMSSDVCKHCTHAACLDVCPTGSLLRTEFGTVVVQDDICNGCGYCVPACPYGVIDRRIGEKGVVANVGVAQKCTLCYDRLKDDLEPACAAACPTQSIQFGNLDELRERAQTRVEQLHAAGVSDARLYGESPPEVYGLPPDPIVTTKDLPAMWRRAALAGVTLLAGAALAFAGGRS